MIASNWIPRYVQVLLDQVTAKVYVGQSQIYKKMPKMFFLDTNM